jgi:hypothetical protein
MAPELRLLVTRLVTRKVGNMVVEIMRFVRSKTAILAAVTLLVCGISAQAALLNPGGALFPAPGEPDPVGGTTVATQTIPFNVPGFFDGSLTSTVIRGGSNPFGANALTFTYRIVNAATSPNAIARMTIDPFTGFQTDASFQTPSVGVNPALIDRNTADVIGFSFSQQIGPGALLPGSNSAVLVVQTNATNFQNALANIIDSGAISVLSFAPVPEPTTLSLAAFGALALIRRRR